MGAVRMSLPGEISQSLIDDGDAVPSVMTRGVGDVVQVLVDAANSSASVVTVAVAAAGLPRAMRKTVEWARRRRPGEASRVVLKRSDREIVVEVPPDMSLKQASELLAKAFHEADHEN